MENYQQDELIELLQELSPKVDATGKNLIIDCPECGKRECSISLKKQGHLWGCFRLKDCGERGNIWNILKRLGKLSKLFKDQYKGSPEQIEYIDIKKLSIFNRDFHSENEDEIVLDVPDRKAPMGWTRTFDDPYLKSRNFNSYHDCFVGRTNMHPAVKKDYVVFLVYQEGISKGWVGRHVWDKKIINEYNQNYFEQHGIKNKIKRYRNSDDTNFANLLYGVDDLDEKNPVPVCIVEGIFDKHALDEKLYLKYDPFMKTVATFKCFVSDTQIARLKLKNVSDIILFYDPDVINQIQQNVKKLECFFNVKIIISSQNKDPDELNQEELIKVFENQIYTPEQIKYDFFQIKKLKF